MRISNGGPDDDFKARVTSLANLDDDSPLDRLPWTVKWQDRQGDTRKILQGDDALLLLAEHVGLGGFHFHTPEGRLGVRLSKLGGAELWRPVAARLEVTSPLSGAVLQRNVYVGVDGLQRRPGNGPERLTTALYPPESDPRFVILVCPPATISVMAPGGGTMPWPELVGPVELAVVNLGATREFEARVETLDQGECDDRPPWPIKWRGSTVARQRILSGDHAILELARPVRYDPDRPEQTTRRFEFRTPTEPRSVARPDHGEIVVGIQVCAAEPVSCIPARVRISSGGGVVQAELECR